MRLRVLRALVRLLAYPAFPSSVFALAFDACEREYDRIYPLVADTYGEDPLGGSWS